MRVFEPLLGFRFERARVGDSGRRGGLGQELLQLLHAVVENLDRGIDVFALRFERDDAGLVLLQRRLRLGALINFVEVQNFFDFDQRETDALAAQDELQLGPVAM